MMVQIIRSVVSKDLKRGNVKESFGFRSLCPVDFGVCILKV